MRRLRRRGYITVWRLLNPPLAKALAASEGYSLVGVRARARLFRLARSVTADGAFCEFGVHRGGTAAVIGLAQPNRELHLFDRWGDLPDPTVEDGTRHITYSRDRIKDKLPGLAQTRTETERCLAAAGLSATLHQGWFTDTLPAYQGRPIAFAHIDCDYYASTCAVLQFLNKHAAPGCLIVSDNWHSWEGERRAISEWCAIRGIEADEIVRLLDDYVAAN